MSSPLRLWGVPQLASREVLVFGAERRFQLLAWLALRSGEWLARDEAAALLWPDHALASARRNLRKVLLDARAVPGVAGLDATEHALRWTVATDLGEFDALLRDGEHGAAIALRRGPLLEAMDEPANAAWTDWLQAHRQRWDARWQHVAHERLKALQGAARADLAQQLLCVDPLDDDAAGAWIEACIARGALASARQAWRTYADRLAQELGIEPPARLRALLDAAQPAPPAAGPAATAPATDAFIGRKAEIAELARLLAQGPVHLVTLLGPGGVGKSRLAQQALRALGAALAAPVLAVAMHDLDTVPQLASRLAHQLGVTLDERHDALVALATRLDTPSLLLLDNAEHLADLGAWVERLLALAPRLKLLVTSRVRLGIDAERLLPLQGLMLPDEDSLDIEVAPSFDAVQLFATRAGAALPGFDLAQHLGAVIEIVQQCAGWPLAIELAAAWVRLLPPQAIARDLRESIDLLERDPALPAAPARPEHASMRTLFERSLALLAPRECEALETLGVFRGSFGRAAAQAVAGTAMPLLASLVDKSLLSLAPGTGFVLHPLIAESARERLAADPPRRSALQERHALYYLRQLADAAADTTVAPQEVDRLMAAAEPDLLQALEHALARAVAGGLLAQTLPIWTSFFRRAGRAREGARRLRPGLHWPAADPLHLRVQARARTALAMLWADAQEPAGEIHALASAALQQARQADDALPQVQCLQVLADCESQADRFEQAQAHLEQAMALAESAGLQAALIACLRTLGSAANRRGRYDDALALMRRARSLAREAGYRTTEADALLAQAEPLLLSGRHGEAETLLRECRHLMAPLRMRLHHCYVVMMHGVALAELGRLGAAREALDEARREAASIGQERYLASIDSYAAWVDALDGRLDDAAATLHRVARHAQASAWVVEAMRALLYHGEVLRRRGRHAEAAAAWQAVGGDARLPAGERDTARRWLAQLPPDGQQQAPPGGAAPSDPQQVLFELLLDPPAG
jgi:predicted ATPase/DNA-binding SARP family transcriptional activator